MRHILIPLFMIISLLFSSFSYAENYNVSAKPDEFLIRSGDLLAIQITINSDDPQWIRDLSNNSEICQAECQQTGLDLTFPLYINVKGEGNVTVGPYEVAIGSETIRTNPIKLVVLPAKTNKEGIFINGVTDPNGSGKFLLRLDYVSPENEPYDIPIVMDESKFLQCKDDPGLIRHFSTNSSSSESGSATYILENTTTDPIKINRDYFKGLPDRYKIPKIIIPPNSH